MSRSRMPPDLLVNRLRQRTAAVVAGGEIRIARVRCGDRVAAHTQGRGRESGNAAGVHGARSQSCGAIHEAHRPGRHTSSRRHGGNRGREGLAIAQTVTGSRTSSAWWSCSAWLTVCVKGLLLLSLAVKFVSPGYDAVIVWLPTLRAEVVKVATPLAFTVPVPRVAVPSMKLTVPVGTPEPGATGATVAVKVTDCPKAVAFEDELSVVVVLAWLTVCVKGLLLLSLAVKFVSPGYDAVIVWLPTPKAEVVKVATPLAFTVPVPRVAVPSMKLTVPVGTPAPGATGATVAVKVTDCPKVVAFEDELSVVVVLAG